MAAATAWLERHVGRYTMRAVNNYRLGSEELLTMMLREDIAFFLVRLEGTDANNESLEHVVVVAVDRRIS